LTSYVEWRETRTPKNSRGGREVTVFLSGFVLGAFALAVVFLLTISIKTRGGDA
jgi:hypothetical protein